MSQRGLSPSVLRLYGLVVRQSVATISGTGIDAQRAGLSGHSEAAAIHTTILGQLDARSVHTCGRYLTLCRRDADLHLVVLTQSSARGHSIPIMSHACGTRTSLTDG